MTSSEFPAGWDEDTVRDVANHYDSQSDEDAAQEDDEASFPPDSPESN